jgi:S-(hydroxymethyl)glutathione dehydrogenase/alcohol dehydrogenase
MKTLANRDTIKTLTTHYIDGAFVESHGREVHGHHQSDERQADRPRYPGRRGGHAARHRRSQGLPFPQAALLGCGVVTGAGAVLNTANVCAGDTVVIFGAGGVGLNAVSGARIAGASRIVVIDIQAKRLDEAQRFGATDVIDSTKTKPVEAVRDLLPGGADHVFDFVGLKAVAEQGLAMLCVGGGLYLVGVAKPDVEIALNIVSAIGGQQRVQGVNLGSTNFKRDIPMYAALYLQGRMNLDDLVSKRISLREVNDGYAALKDGSLNRVVVTSF